MLTLDKNAVITCYIALVLHFEIQVSKLAQQNKKRKSLTVENRNWFKNGFYVKLPVDGIMPFI